jgi:hypothetical protein
MTISGPQNTTSPIDERVLESIAEKVADKAVNKALRGLGIDPDDSESVRVWQNERAYVRNAMHGNSLVKQGVISATVAALVSFLTKFLTVPPAGPTH